MPQEQISQLTIVMLLPHITEVLKSVLPSQYTVKKSPEIQQQP
jgi:hypothetical protein